MGVSTVKLNGSTLMTVNDTTATASDVAQSKYFYTAAGEKELGTASGGGSQEVPENDVNFYDFDGSVIASYSASDFANLSAMPANPSHTGLTAQGWNWTLSNAKTHVQTGGKLNVGQMYRSTDNKTRLYIEIPEDAQGTQLTFYVRYTQTVSQGVTVDWGDGSSAETFTGTTAANRSHTFSSAGKYVITLNVTSGSVSFVGSASNGIYGSTSNYYNRTRIYKAEIGSNVTSIGSYAFYYCYNLESVTIPSTVTAIDSYAFNACYKLRSITIPSGITSIGNYGFQYCYSLKKVALPSGLTGIGSYAFASCYGLKSVTVPNTVTIIDSYAFNSSYTLNAVIIPSSVATIGNNAFQTSYGLAAITVLPTTPPSIGTNVFASMGNTAKIYVPYSADHSVFTAYQNATNWSSYKSQMVELPAA